MLAEMSLDNTITVIRAALQNAVSSVMSEVDDSEGEENREQVE